MKNTVKLIAMCLAFSLLGGWHSAMAANIKMEVKVPGISSWVLVKLDAWPKYGGHVVYDPRQGCYVTDDVARGESTRITISPSGESLDPYQTVMTVWCNSRQTALFQNFITMPSTVNLQIPTNPSYDDNYIYVFSNFYLADPRFSYVRIPIGPRVK